MSTLRLRICRQGLEPVAATLRTLGCMAELTALDLAGTSCEEDDAFNRALAGLQPLRQLAVLNLAGTGLTSTGLANLWKLRVRMQALSHVLVMRAMLVMSLH